MEHNSNQNNGEKRVVSFFIWDPELEHKIDCEVKMIDGISKLLNVATTLEQTIECNKALVLSQQRMLAFMAEIQRKQQNLLMHDNKDLQPTKARVILSDIRLPLTWTNMKVKPDQKKFAVFCLARIGCQILDTSMISVDKTAAEIVFKDRLVFENVPHDFQLHLEVYALNKSLVLSSAAKDFANRYSNYFINGSSSFLRKASATNSVNHKVSQQQQTKFTLIARTVLTKEAVFKIAQVRHLQMENLSDNSFMRLPIRTSFIARLYVEPFCYTCLPTYKGMVERFDRQYLCRISAGFLHADEVVRFDFSNQHRFSLPIDSNTVIIPNFNKLSFSILNSGFAPEQFHVEDLFTLSNLIRAIRQHIIDIRAWESTFEHIPPERRYSYQLANSTATSTTFAKDPKDEFVSRAKTRSVESFSQRKSSSSSTLTNSSNQFEHKDRCFYRLSTDDDDDDNNNYEASMYQIRI